MTALRRRVLVRTIDPNGEWTWRPLTPAARDTVRLALDMYAATVLRSADRLPDADEMRHQLEAEARFALALAEDFNTEQEEETNHV